jgi:hypothetical protein
MGKWKAVFPIALALVIALSGSVFLIKRFQSQIMQAGLWFIDIIGGFIICLSGITGG